MRKILLIIIVALIGCSLYSAETIIPETGGVDLKLLKSGTNVYRFCDAKAIDEYVTGDTVDAIADFVFDPISDNTSSTSAELGVFWSLFTNETPETVNISLKFMASQDNANLNCMMWNENINDPAYLNYNVSATVKSFSDEEAVPQPAEITIAPLSIASNLIPITDRTMTLVSNASLGAYDWLSGGAVVTLSMNPPRDASNNITGYIGASYEGAIILDITSN